MRSSLSCSVHICLTWKHKAKQSREEEEWQTIQRGRRVANNCREEEEWKRGRRVANNSALMRLPVPLGLSTIPPPLPLHPQSRATTRKEGGMCVRGSNRPGSKRLYCIQQSTVDNPHLCIYFCSSCNSPGPMSSWKSMTILDSIFLVFDHDPWSPFDPKFWKHLFNMILFFCVHQS